TYIKPFVVAFALFSMNSCSGSKNEQTKLDYKSLSHRLVKLEVPPDLNIPYLGIVYQLAAGSWAVRASELNKIRTQDVQE
ncbi:outer membrane protein assembly factor BamC, partial [Neisseria sp. P0015.S009]